MPDRCQSCLVTCSRLCESLTESLIGGSHFRRSMPESYQVADRCAASLPFVVRRATPSRSYRVADRCYPTLSYTVGKCGRLTIAYSVGCCRTCTPTLPPGNKLSYSVGCCGRCRICTYTVGACRARAYARPKSLAKRRSRFASYVLTELLIGGNPRTGQFIHLPRCQSSPNPVLRELTIDLVNLRICDTLMARVHIVE